MHLTASIEATTNRSLFLDILCIIMEKMSTTIAMTCCNSATSMSITNAQVLSPNNRLTPAERKAFGRSDHKAGKVLGVTLTRNHVGQDKRLSLCLSQDQEIFQGDNEDGAVVGTKRSFSRTASTATIIGPLQDRLGRILASGMKMVEKRNKGRVAAGGYPPRIVLGLLRSNELPGKEGMEELPTGVSDEICARPLAELDENENTEAPLGAEFLERNEEDDPFGGSPMDLVRDVENPLASPALDRRVSPVASPIHFEVSSEEESLALSSDDSFDYMLRPAERAYVDFLIAQDEAEGQTMERIALRSRNKVLDVLGAEARQAVNEHC